MEEYDSMFGAYKTDTLPTMLFNSYFMMRRIAYACIIVFMKDFPLMQAFSFVMICIPIFSLNVVMKPYLQQIENVIMIINEATLLVVGSAFFFFSEPSEDQDLMKKLGFMIIGLLILVITFNILVLMILKIKLIYRVRNILRF